MQGLARSIALVLSLTLVGKAAGFAREALVAASYGVTPATDAFVVAMTLPDFLRGVLADGALGAVLVSVLVASDRERPGSARIVASTVLAVLLAGGVLLGALFLAWPRGVVLFLAPSFPGASVLFAETLLRWLSPVLLLSAVSGVLYALLNSRRVYGLPTGASVVSSLIICAGLVAAGGGGDVRRLAQLTVAGALGQLAVMLWAAWHNGLPRMGPIRPGDPGVRKLQSLLPPVLLTVAISQVALVANRMIASGLPSGSIAAYGFADQLLNMPLFIAMSAVTTVYLPEMARLAAEKEDSAFRSMAAGGLLLALCGGVLVAALTAALAPSLVSVAFQRGRFSAESAANTAQILALLAPGAIAYPANAVLGRAMVARQDVKTPMRLSLMSVSISIAAGLLLRGPLGAPGLGLATSLGTLSWGIGALALSHRPLGLAPWQFARQAGALLLAGGAAAGAAWAAAATVSGQIAPGFGQSLAALLAGGCTGSAVFLVVATILLPSLRLAVVRLRAVPPTEQGQSDHQAGA